MDGGVAAVEKLQKDQERKVEKAVENLTRYATDMLNLDRRIVQEEIGMQLPPVTAPGTGPWVWPPN